MLGLVVYIGSLVQEHDGRLRVPPRTGEYQWRALIVVFVVD